MREAAADMRAAATDAWHIVGVARASATSLAPMALEFARDRIDTLRAALAEFMQGYTQGTQEVPPPPLLCLYPDVCGLHGRM